jgi:hypothetical protein
MQIGKTIFAYGGSGIILSKPAAERCSKQYHSNVSTWNTYTDREWAGDCVLGVAMMLSGIELRWAWPIMYTESLAQAFPEEEQYSRRLWCHPVGSLHHMQPDEIEHLWLFERQWRLQNPGSILLYKDVFKHYVLPQMYRRRNHWDNLSERSTSITSLSECEAACISQSACLQYSFSNKTCRTSDTARLGRTKENV